LRSIRGVKDNSSNDYTNFTVTKEDNEKWVFNHINQKIKKHLSGKKYLYCWAAGSGTGKSSSWTKHRKRSQRLWLEPSQICGLTYIQLDVNSIEKELWCSPLLIFFMV
jgi:hypothetical protein